MTTAAAAGRPNVRALVYITAFAPDEDEAFSTLLGRFGDSDVIATLVPDAAGAFYIDTARFNEVFAGGLPTEQASVMGATQKPLAGSIFGASVEGAPRLRGSVRRMPSRLVSHVWVSLAYGQEWRPMSNSGYNMGEALRK